jgi:hypothetical protein
LAAGPRLLAIDRRHNRLLTHRARRQFYQGHECLRFRVKFGASFDKLTQAFPTLSPSRGRRAKVRCARRTRAVANSGRVT